MQPENIAEYQAPNDLVDLSSAYENRPGVSFILQQNPSIRVYFKNNVSISTVALQPTFRNRTTNIIKFSVFYVTWDNKPYVDPKTGRVLTFTTTDGDQSLTIQHEIIPDLKGFNLTILGTSEELPRFFRLMVLGCYKSSSLTFSVLFSSFDSSFLAGVTYVFTSPTMTPPTQTTSSMNATGATISESSKQLNETSIETSLFFYSLVSEIEYFDSYESL